MEGNIHKKNFPLAAMLYILAETLKAWLTSSVFTCSETSNMWSCGFPLHNKGILSWRDISYNFDMPCSFLVNCSFSASSSGASDLKGSYVHVILWRFCIKSLLHFSFFCSYDIFFILYIYFFSLDVLWAECCNVISLTLAVALASAIFTLHIFLFC